MMITSYAQNFEDVILWRALKTVKNGFYIDIGAQDPVVDSVSLSFYEAGWRGAHVEPVAAYAQMLRDARPEEDVIEAVIAASPGQIEFHEFGHTGLSTGISEIAERHQKSGFKSRPVHVLCMRLSDVLERYKHREVHWLKIDVEGMERTVLESWGTSHLRPWIVVVESTAPLETVPTFQEWEQLLLDRNYRFVYFDGLNRFYVHDAHQELASFFGPGPNCFDGFHLASTTSYAANLAEECAYYLNEQIDAQRKIAEFSSSLEELNGRFMSAQAANEDVRRSAADMLRQERQDGQQKTINLKSTIQNLSDKVETARIVTEKLQRDCDNALREQRKEAQQQVDDLNLQLGQLREELKNAQAERANLQRKISADAERNSAAIDELTARRQEATERIDAMLSSTSWRLTQPLRLARTAVNVLRNEPSSFLPLVRRRFVRPSLRPQAPPASLMQLAEERAEFVMPPVVQRRWDEAETAPVRSTLEPVAKVIFDDLLESIAKHRGQNANRG